MHVIVVYLEVVKQLYELLLRERVDVLNLSVQHARLRLNLEAQVVRPDYELERRLHDVVLVHDYGGNGLSQLVLCLLFDNVVDLKLIAQIHYHVIDAHLGKLLELLNLCHAGLRVLNQLQLVVCAQKLVLVVLVDHRVHDVNVGVADNCQVVAYRRGLDLVHKDYILF